MKRATWSGLDFQTFAVQRHALLSDPNRPANLIDGANTHLYGTLSRLDSITFSAIPPSDDRRAPHRCHLAESFLAHLGLAQETYKPRSLISHGVRHSLSLIFKSLSLSRSHHLILPSDVYPAYGALAQETGMEYATYPARQGLPWARLKSHPRWCLLVCDPLKPWGGPLDDMQWDRLANVALATGSIVLIDSAYDLSLSPSLRKHLASQSPFVVMGSLSKGWLLPVRGGIVLANETLSQAWRETFQQASRNEVATREAFAALNDYPDRPAKVNEKINQSRHKMLALLSKQDVGVSDPGSGYFLTSSLTPEELLDRDILGLSASVFGEVTANGSLISTLGALEILPSQI